MLETIVQAHTLTCTHGQTSVHTGILGHARTLSYTSVHTQLGANSHALIADLLMEDQ